MCLQSHDLWRGENPSVKTSMFEDHRSETYTSRFPMYWNNTWKLMSVLVLWLVWSSVNKTYVLCLIYHDERNPHHQIISQLIASQIIKNYTLNSFYWYYSLYTIQLKIISRKLISWMYYQLTLTLFKLFWKGWRKIPIGYGV